MIPDHLLRPKLYLFDFDGVITTEEEDVALKAQTLTVFTAVAKRFDERAIKMVRLLGHAVYKAGGTFSLGPLLFEAAQLLKPHNSTFEPTLEKLIDACIGNLDYHCIAQAAPVIHQGLHQLRQHQVELAIFSNGVRQNALNILAIKSLERLIPAEHVFDAISTHNTKGRLHPKPDPEGYKRVLDELGVAPEDCVFVDNSRKNVRAAKKAVKCRGVIYIGHKLKRKDRGIIDYIAPSLEILMQQMVKQQAL